MSIKIDHLLCWTQHLKKKYLSQKSIYFLYLSILIFENKCDWCDFASIVIQAHSLFDSDRKKSAT